MAEPAPEIPFRAGAANWRPVRLGTLVLLRWLAVVGQLASIAIVIFVFRFPLPLAPSLILIGLSAALNIGLQIRFGPGHMLPNRLATLLLAFDSLQLGGLLWLTGGLENPFAILLLAPVSVSATTLDQRATVLLALLIGITITVLAASHWPLPWDPHYPLQFNQLYISGVWAALLLGVAFVAAYTNRVAHEARQLADALAATELALSRQQQLRALDGLAAAAAHELGTPLSTIALAAREMQGDLKDSPLAEDAGLIVEQVGRCRAILGKLRNLGAERDDPFAAVPLGELLAEVVSPHEAAGKTILFEVQPIAGSEPVLNRAVGLLYGLGNLVENAVHFASSKVIILTRWDETAVTITITDDGPGFPPDLIARLGEPYLTTRGKEQPGAAGTGHVGLGLGIFIAKTLLERTGASLTFANRSAAGHAEVTVRWPRSEMAALNAQN